MRRRVEEGGRFMVPTAPMALLHHSPMSPVALSPLGLPRVLRWGVRGERGSTPPRECRQPPAPHSRRSIARDDLEHCIGTEGELHPDFHRWARDLCARWHADTEAMESFNKTVKIEVQRCPHIGQGLLSSRAVNKTFVHSNVLSSDVSRRASAPMLIGGALRVVGGGVWAS
eukprot:9477562-Pyramimonas_sp.AAC.1